MDKLVKLGLVDVNYNLVPYVPKNWLSIQSVSEQRMAKEMDKERGGRFGHNARMKLVPKDGHVETRDDRLQALELKCQLTLSPNPPDLLEDNTIFRQHVLTNRLVQASKQYKDRCARVARVERAIKKKEHILQCLNQYETQDVEEGQEPQAPPPLKLRTVGSTEEDDRQPKRKDPLK